MLIVWQLLLLIMNVIALGVVNAAAPVNPHWYFCSNENAFCNSKGKIRFGANGKYFYNRFPNGTFHYGAGSQCSNTFFGGDPAPGEKKQCWTNVDITKKENQVIHAPRMVMIVPGFGLPHIETKRVILENNIKMFGKVPPDVIVCQYDGEQITFPNVKVYYQKGFVG